MIGRVDGLAEGLFVTTVYPLDVLDTEFEELIRDVAFPATALAIKTVFKSPLLISLAISDVVWLYSEANTVASSQLVQSCFITVVYLTSTEPCSRRLVAVRLSV